MKLKDIEVGKRYIVQIPARIDRVINEQAKSGEVIAVVEEIGIGYGVETYTSSMVRGAGWTRTHQSANNDGVRVRWEDQNVPWRFGRGHTDILAGTGILAARAIKRATDKESLA